MRSKAGTFLALLSVLWMMMGVGAQAQTAPGVPVIAVPGLTRCGTGTLTFTITSIANTAANDKILLFAAGAYPPATAPADLTPAAAGWLYNFDVAASVAYTATSTNTAGTPSAIPLTTLLSGTNGPTYVGVRASGSSNVQFSTTTNVDGDASLSLPGDQNTTQGRNRFILRGFSGAAPFYCSFKTSITAAEGNTFFKFGLGSSASTSFDAATATAPATTDFFTGLNFNATGATFNIANLANTTNYATTLAYGGTGIATTAHLVEMYGNPFAFRIFYKRGASVYSLGAGKTDIWINSTLVTAADETSENATPNIDALIFYSSNTGTAPGATVRMQVDDIRFISNIAYSTEVSTYTQGICNAGCTTPTTNLVTPILTTTTSFLVAGESLTAANLGLASPTGTAITATVNAALGALTGPTSAAICGTSSASNPVVISQTLPAGANGIAIYATAANAAANTTPLSSAVGLSATVSGTTVTSRYTGTGVTNGVPFTGYYRPIYTTSGPDIPLLATATSVATGCLGPITPITFTANWSPTSQPTAAANFTIGTLAVAAPVAPMYGNTTDRKSVV